jgi:hypothetical protein
MTDDDKELFTRKLELLNPAEANVLMAVEVALSRTCREQSVNHPLDARFVRLDAAIVRFLMEARQK